ncbi:MAG TPA: hypothetical protein VK797_12860 [Tepidisphaeraceae bacterium]|jgi:hypothetical protein|nr:hypothetical protein [Tepidisphaeraceae bacterium]
MLRFISWFRRADLPKNRSKESAEAKGFKVATAPKNADRRKLMTAEDITASGGCRTTPPRQVR